MALRTKHVDSRIGRFELLYELFCTRHAGVFISSPIPSMSFIAREGRACCVAADLALPNVLISEDRHVSSASPPEAGSCSLNFTASGYFCRLKA